MTLFGNDRIFLIYHKYGYSCVNISLGTKHYRVLIGQLSYSYTVTVSKV
jgi:hypothetical protein